MFYKIIRGDSFDLPMLLFIIPGIHIMNDHVETAVLKLGVIDDLFRQL